MTAREGASRPIPPWTALGSVATGIACIIPAGAGLKAVALIGCVLIPGAALLELFGAEFSRRYSRFFLASALGFIAMAGIGVVASTHLPLIGVSSPIARIPLTVVWLGILALIVVLSIRRNVDPLAAILGGISARAWFTTLPLGLLPAAAIVGAERIDAGRGNAVAVTVTVCSVAIFTFAAFTSRSGIGRMLPSAVFASSVALVWQQSFRGDWLFGSDIQHEYSVAARTISDGLVPLTTRRDPYEVMLSISAIPGQLHALADVPVEVVLRLVPGIVIGCIVLGVMGLLHDFSGRRSALPFTVLYAGLSLALIRELPSVSRQCLALIAFVAMCAAAVPGPDVRRSRLLAATFAVAIPFFHYSTAYVAVTLLGAGVLIGVLIRRLRNTGDVTLPAPILSGSVLTAALVATVAWSFTAAGGAGQFSTLQREVRQEGLAFLPGAGNPIARWIQAASAEVIPADRLQELDRLETAEKRPWLDVDPRAESIRLVDDPAPTRDPVEPFGRLYGFALTITTQLFLLGSVAAVVLLLRPRAPTTRLPIEIIGMGAGAIIVGAVARSSGTFARSFGPARMQVQIGIVLVLALAAVWTTLPTRIRMRSLGVVATAGIVGMVSVAGFAPFVTGGNPVAALAADGENTERFTISRPLLETAEWTVENSDGGLVQTDPNGALALANFNGINENTVRSVDPIAVDLTAWVLATPTNLVKDRARGVVDEQFAAFEFPERFYDETRPVIFATGTTKVYGPAVFP